ncbi:GNAT family N-acetyltransferase, partial [Anaerolineae bacterium CFX7]|nr:GNAT family N-acetyltransferase [Anaerolineae bacterium CFX7]
MNLRVEVYAAARKKQWDEFIRQSKNGTFLFLRDYLEYHADRFTDHSLLFFDTDTLIGLLPANIQETKLVSHGGLTYGGVVSNERMSASKMLALFDALIPYLQTRGITQLIYKAIPHIYHTIPAEEDLYALYRHNARLIRRDVSSTLDRRAPVKLSKGRRWSLKRAKKSELVIRASVDYETFMTIEAHVLQTRHGVKPVHTAAEIAMLAHRFSQNIELYAAFRDERMLAGVIMYVSTNVAHAQYISASDEGRECGALDLILDHLINE